MDSDQGKLFIYEISLLTTELNLGEYFSKYGKVLQTCVMRDKRTGVPRGFGFVVFADPSVLATVLQDKHMIDGRTVEVKKPFPKVDNFNAGRNCGGSGNDKTKKIIVGGLPPTLSEGEFSNYFESYGNVTGAVFLCDNQTNQPRGFGIISFESEDAVDRVLHKSYHYLGGEKVEVKRLFFKYGGGYQGFSCSSGGN